MLMVRTRVDKSDIHGIGLFADEFIREGKIIWVFVDSFDRSFTQDEYSKFNVTEKEFIDTYGWKSNNTYFLSVDNERFTNHQDNPNCECVGNKLIIAKVDIEKGTELTIDYSQIDDEWEKYKDSMHQ